MADQKLSQRGNLVNSNDDAIIHVVDGGISYQQTKDNFLKEVLLVFADLAALIATQGTQRISSLYEVTDASGFTTITSGRAWVRYKGTIAGDETDYIIVSKEEGLSGGGTGDVTLSGNNTFTGQNTFNGSQFLVNRTGIFTPTTQQPAITAIGWTTGSLADINVTHNSTNAASSGVRVNGVTGSLGNLFEGRNNSTTTFTVNKDGDVVANSFVGDGSGLTNLPSGGTDDQTASEVPFTPYLTLASTNIQLAVQELKDEVDDLVSSGYAAPVSKTGLTINLNQNAKYNELVPLSGSLVLQNLTVGTVVSVYLISDFVPSVTVPVGVDLLINLQNYVFDNSTLNVITFEVTPEGNISSVIQSYNDVPAVVYEAEVQAVIDAAVLNGDAIPSNANLGRMNTFIAGLKAIRNDADTVTTNLLNQLDIVEIYINSLEEFSKYDFISGAKIATEVGTGAVFGGSGWKGATNGALEASSTLLSALVNFQQNDASLGIYQLGVTTGYPVGAIQDSATTRRSLYGHAGTGTDFFGLNSNGLSLVDAYEEGFILLDRDNSADFNLYKNGVLATNIAAVSTVPADQTMYVGARHFSGVDAPSDGFTGLIILGASVKDYQASLNTLVEALVTP